MEIETIEDEYRTLLGKHKDEDAPTVFDRLQFELLLEIAYELRAIRTDDGNVFGK